MKKTIIALAAAAALAGCTTAEQAGTVGAIGGAAVGLATTGTGTGALVGAAAGGLGGYVIGKLIDRPGYCEYQDRNTGRRYVERCP